MRELLPHSRTVNLAILAVLWAALLAWQALTIHSRRLAPFAVVVALARRWRPVRWAVLLGWAWLGWHLFVRTTY